MPTSDSRELDGKTLNLVRPLSDPKNQLTNNDESSYREEWCTGNNLLLSVRKSKDLIVDFRKKGGNTPLSISVELRRSR